jgi:hypothetical protein
MLRLLLLLLLLRVGGVLQPQLLRLCGGQQ